MTTEKAVESYLVLKARRAGGQAIKIYAQTQSNLPDRLVVLPNATIFFVEAKSTTGRLRPGQTRKIEFLRSLGFKVHVTHSRADTDAIFTEYGF